MATTKVVTVLANSVTLTAGDGPFSYTSSVATIDDGYGCCLFVIITNDATGPTKACQWKIEVSGDNSNWYDFGGPLLGGKENAETYSWGGIEIPVGVEYLRVKAGDNETDDVTFRVEIVEVTAVR